MGEDKKVRAKFVCNSSVECQEGSVQYSFSAATQGDENKSWAKYTPGGSLTIQIDNPAAQVFERGKSYFLDFSAAD